MLDKCSHIMTAEGDEPLDSERRKQVQDVVEAMETKNQLKVICLASRKREERSSKYTVCRFLEEILDVFVLIDSMYRTCS